MKYTEIPRKKFTPKQLELLEKVHWLHCKVRKNYYSCINDYEIEEKYGQLSEKAVDNLL